MSASKKCSRAHSHLYEDSFRYLAYIYVQKSSSEAPRLSGEQEVMSWVGDLIISCSYACLRPAGSFDIRFRQNPRLSHTTVPGVSFRKKARTLLSIDVPPLRKNCSPN